MKHLFGIIGDIHGELDALNRLLATVDEQVERLIFIGDYVNRGGRSAEVLDRLVGLNTKRPCTFLAGNHDVAMLDALKRDKFDTFLRIGGAATVRTYVAEPFGDVAKQFVAQVPASHVEFLTALKPSFETEALVVTHEPKELEVLRKGRFGVCGHVPQRDGLPSVSANHAHIDTGFAD